MWETTTVATAGPMVSYLQKKRSSELIKFVRNTGIAPNLTKQLPALPCPPAPPQHRGRPALPSIFGVPPGYSAARLQHMSQHRGSRFPFSGFRTVISTGHPYTPAPPRSPQLTQPRPRFYRRFPTISMPQHGRWNPGATHSACPHVPKVMGVHPADLLCHARMAS